MRMERQIKMWMVKKNKKCKIRKEKTKKSKLEKAISTSSGTSRNPVDDLWNT